MKTYSTGYYVLIVLPLFLFLHGLYSMANFGALMFRERKLGCRYTLHVALDLAMATPSCFCGLLRKTEAELRKYVFH